MRWEGPWKTMAAPVLAAALSVAASHLATAQPAITDEQRLDGITHTSKDGCPEGDAGPCTIYFELYGDTAKRFYKAMRAKPRTDECTGGTMKTDGSGLHCYRGGDGSHGCYFGYSAVSKQMTDGKFSC